MAEKVAKAGIRKQNGYLYFIDKGGDISRVEMARGGKRKGKGKKVKKAELSDDFQIEVKS